jgi:hypothetical protein
MSLPGKGSLRTASESQNSDKSCNLPASAGATTPRICLSSSKPTGTETCAGRERHKEAVGGERGRTRYRWCELARLVGAGKELLLRGNAD